MEAEGGMDVKSRKKLLGMMEMFIIFIVVMVLFVHTFVKTEQIAYFIYVWLHVLQLYLNKVGEK